MIVVKENKKLNEATLEIPKINKTNVIEWDRMPIGNLAELKASYEDFVESNWHTGAAYLLAKFARNGKAMQILIYIDTIHTLIGSLPHGLDKLRYDVSQPIYNKYLANYRG